MINDKKPLISYLNLTIKSHIFQENKNKSGIYRWNNLITKKSYVGSVINLIRRLRQYLSINHLNSTLLRSRSFICTSLLKYGYSNFSLDILEYCDSNILIKREQYY